MTTQQTIDRILEEGALGPTALARLVGSFRNGRPTHASTIVRWMRDGVVLPGGRRIVLEHIKCSNRLLSSRQALNRFLVAQQTEAGGVSDAPRSSSERERAINQAEIQLRAAGVP